MKQRKKSNKQYNQRNFSRWIYKKDLARRRAELKKEERLKAKWMIIRWSMFAYINIAFWSIVLFNLDTQWTVANLTLALVSYTVTSCIALVIGRVAMYKKYEQVSLKSGEGSMITPFYDIETPTSDDTNLFTEISDKQIVIEADSMPERWFFTFLFFIGGGGFLCFFDMHEDSFSIAFTMLQFAIALFLAGLYFGISPWQEVVIDRESKTITFPPWTIFNKPQKIPYEEAVITYRTCTTTFRLSEWGEEDVVLACPRRWLFVFLKINGIKTGYRFARLIRAYMGDEELPDIPAFSKYKNRKKGNDEIE